MPDDSNSENEKKEEQTSKPQSKKKKRKRNPNRAIENMMKQAMKQASLANDIEQQLRASHDVMRIMEESTRVSREMDRLMGPTLTMNQLFGPGTMEGVAESLSDKVKYYFEDPINNALKQIENYAIGKFEDHSNIVKDALSYKPLEDVFAPLSEKFAWMDAFNTNPLDDIIENINKTYSVNLKDALKISSILEDFYTDIPETEMFVSTEETIRLNGNSYEISNIKEIINDGLESAGFFNKNAISHNDIKNLKDEIKKIKETPLQKIVWIFISYILLSIFGQPIETSLINLKNKINTKDKVAATKFIEKEIPKKIDDKFIFQNLRFVTADVLRVRSRDYQKSDLIGKLYLGDVVTIIRKKKHWTLMKWEDKENDLEIQGWVFSRYLRKFRF